jgi:Domain of unknown function (DUF4416)
MTMAPPHLSRPVLLVAAIFSRHDDALGWARDRLQALLGPIAFAAEPFSFHHTAYYESTMGAGLHKQLLAFEKMVREDELSTIKLQTNALEEELSGSGRFPEPRPLNLDPGLLTLGKFMLATTKDQSHRIYLRDGIFAEVTLRFQGGTFEPWTWTYADYREPAVVATLNRFREYYRQRVAKGE